MTVDRRVRWGRWIFQGVVALAALWLAWKARAIWFPVGVAVVIAMVLDPVVDRLENRGCPRGIATGLVFLAFLGATTLSVLVLSPGISAQAGEIARDLGKLFPQPERPDLERPTRQILYRVELPPVVRDAALQAARAGTENLSRALEGASTLAVAWAPNLMWVLVVPVLAFYLLIDFHKIYAKGILLVPRRHRSFAQTLVAEISAVFGKYLRGLALVCFLLGLTLAGVFLALGSKYWQLLGLLGGVLYAIPVVGSLFTLAVVVLATVAAGSPGKALMLGGAMVVVTNGVFDQVITPRVLGRQVGLHPVLTILALLVGYQVWGITGMLVAVPITASIQTVIVHLIPKLGAELELRPLEELQKTEAETKAAHLEADAEALDDHYCLHSVIENVERPAA